MADKIRKVDYFKMEASNKAGEGARILNTLREDGINMLAFTGFPMGRRAQIDFIPENSAAFKKAAKRAKLKISAKKTGFLVQGEDRIGAIADVLTRLAESKINVTAIDALSAGAGRWGAILWVKTADIRKAAKALGAK